MTWSIRCAAVCVARRTRRKSPVLAAEGDDLVVVAAIAAPQAQETVRQDAALEEGDELVLDELRQTDAGGLIGLGVLLRHTLTVRSL